MFASYWSGGVVTAKCGASQLLRDDCFHSDGGLDPERGFRLEDMSSAGAGELHHEGHGAHGHVRDASGRRRQGHPHPQILQHGRGLHADHSSSSDAFIIGVLLRAAGSLWRRHIVEVGLAQSLLSFRRFLARLASPLSERGPRRRRGTATLRHFRAWTRASATPSCGGP